MDFFWEGGGGAGGCLLFAKKENGNGNEISRKPVRETDIRALNERFFSQLPLQTSTKNEKKSQINGLAI